MSSRFKSFGPALPFLLVAAMTSTCAHAAQDRRLTLKSTTELGKPAAAADAWSAKLRRTPIQIEPAGNLFGSKDWTPRAAPPPVAAKVEPTPPTFPYQYMGKLEMDGMPTTVYLTRGPQVFTVSVGDVLEGIYRVAELGADRIEVIYLPLSKKQVVTFSTIVPESQPASTVVTSSLPAAASQIATASVLSTPPQTSSARPEQHPATIVGGTIPGSASAAQRATTSAAVASSGTMVISAPTIAAMPTAAPTIREMPMSAPSGQSMPILPPSAGEMPMTPPAARM